MKGLDLVEAMVAGARGPSTGVEVGVVVKGKGGVGVPVTEDVAAFAAVMSSDEVVECALASWIIADRRLGVGLPVLAGGHTGDLWESVQLPFAVKGPIAFARRASRKALTKHRKAGNAHESSVCASQGGVRLGGRSRACGSAPGHLA